MKILHTADVHLNEFEGQRWQAFKQVLDLGKTEKVDGLVIAGDLFDKNLDAVQLRLEIEQLFSNYSFPIFILPGNHDYKAYQDDPFWGNNVHVFKDLSKPYVIDKVSFWGLPFEDLNESQIVRRLENINEKLDKDKTNIFVYHGELIDTFYSGQSSQAFGNEGEKRYLPMKLSYLKNLDFDYVLAGHFHSQFDLKKPSENQFFVYPGSPVSITKRETGPRKVNIFEVGQPPQENEISTPYYTEINYRLNPFTNQKPIDEIKEKLEKLPVQAMPLVSVRGFFDSQTLGMSKRDLVKKLGKFTDDCLINDVKTVLSDPLFEEFGNRLEDEKVENGKEIKHLVIESMMEAKMQK